MQSAQTRLRLAPMFLQDAKKKVQEMRKKEGILKTTAQTLSAM